MRSAVAVSLSPFFGQSLCHVHVDVVSVVLHNIHRIVIPALQLCCAWCMGQLSSLCLQRLKHAWPHGEIDERVYRTLVLVRASCSARVQERSAAGLLAAPPRGQPDERERLSRRCGEAQHGTLCCAHIAVISSLAATVSGDRPQKSSTAYVKETSRAAMHTAHASSRGEGGTAGCQRWRQRLTELAPCCNRTRTHSLRPCIAAQ